jgi:2-polyprenyl-3-methyl-5-hydroxy-6-metoxy-1,4-benzoquinol methylase
MIRLHNDVISFKRTLSICKNCELVYTSEILPKEVMKQIYDSGIINSSITNTINVDEERHNFVINNWSKRGNIDICDIGCSTGDFIIQFKKDNFNLYGVEISSIASKIGKQRGINIECNDWNNTSYDNKFDIITAIHTLEHLYEPRQFIKNYYKALKEDGMLFIEVPTFNDLEYISINPYNQTHTICFSTNTLISFLKNMNFYIYRIEENKSKLYGSTLKVLATKITPMQFLKKEKEYVMEYKSKIIENIKNILIEWSIDNKTIYIYGAGNNAVDLLSGIYEDDWNNIDIVAFLDKDEKKVGGKIFGVPILKFGENVNPTNILILSKLELERIMTEDIKKVYPNAVISHPYEDICTTKS